MSLKLVPAAFACVAALAFASGSGAHRADTPSRTVATITSLDYRAVIAASKTSNGSSPTATVTVATYIRVGGSWRQANRRRLSGTYFWKTVTAPHALCRLELRTTPRPHLIVQLLQTPAIGCGPATVLLFDRRA